MKHPAIAASLAVFVLACGQDEDSYLTEPLSVEVRTSAAASGNFAAHLEGRNEVPPRGTQAQGQATFKWSRDGGQIDYKLIVANITNVLMAHIHMAPAGQNGPIVVWLYPAAPPPLSIPGRFDGVLAEGSITAANLTGPLAGATLDDLLAALRAGNAYVNVHTNDFADPPNTGPGDFPGGEVRGQIR